MLWQELQAAQTLLKKIDPEAFSEPDILHFRDDDTIPLGGADFAVLWRSI